MHTGGRLFQNGAMTDKTKIQNSNDVGEGEALDALRECRRGAIDLCAAYGYHSGVSRQSTHLLKLIDRLGHMLTDDPRYFWDKHCGTPGKPYDKVSWRELVKKRDD